MVKRAVFLFAICFLTSVFGATAAPKSSAALDPLQKKPGELHAFYGKITNIDRGERTITIALGMRFTFHVPNETQIKIRKGAVVDFNALRLGEGAEVVARRGAKSWTAVKVRLDPDASFPEEVSAKTVSGKTIYGPEVVKCVAYRPPTEVVNRNINFGTLRGVFLLSIGHDGNVVSVRPIRSLGLREWDERYIKRLLEFRFRPGTVTEVRIPVTVRSIRTY